MAQLLENIEDLSMKIERLKGERNHRQALREIDSLIESFPEEMKLYTERCK